MCVYQIVKDFAGPAATVIAAAVAVFVTWRLGEGQLQVAQQQATTAFDQLHYNLFEKQYAIYAAATEAIDSAFYRRGEDVLPKEIKRTLLTFDEARFFFRPDICAILETLHKDIMNVLQQHYNHRKAKEGFTKPYTAEVRKTIAEREIELLKLEEGLYIAQRNLPKTFAPALAFPQLTR